MQQCCATSWAKKVACITSLEITIIACLHTFFLLTFAHADLSKNILDKAQELGKKIFTLEEAEILKRTDLSMSSVKWKLQSVSASVDLTVWTADDEQGEQTCRVNAFTQEDKQR